MKQRLNKKQAEAEVVPSSGLVNLKLRLKIPQVQVKLQQPSTKLKLKFKRQVHYFFRNGWVVGKNREQAGAELCQAQHSLRLDLDTN